MRTVYYGGGEYSPGKYVHGTIAGVFIHFSERDSTSTVQSVASPTAESNSNYTDFHSVDEDMRTLSMQSGDWIDVYGAGIVYRTMSNDQNAYFDFVASMCRHL